MNQQISTRLLQVSTYLSKREKQIGVAIAVFTLAGFLFTWLPYVISASSHKVPKGVHPLEYLLVGVAMVVGALAGALFSRRLIGGALFMLLAFGPWGSSIILGFPALAFGAFVAFKRDARTMAARREESERKREERRQVKATAKNSTKGGKPLPAPSKRYTPPASTRRRSKKNN